jgi:hypothetical protein
MVLFSRIKQAIELKFIAEIRRRYGATWRWNVAIAIALVHALYCAVV